VEGEEGPKYEMEAAVFPEQNVLGVQYHPEVMKVNEPGRIHFTDMVKDFLNSPMDEFVKQYGRKTKDEPRQEQAGGASA
jgi:GMP synthase-like glutamine amidotransferase